ncbi:serine/threonine-protein kinase [Streptomyces yunnanensis]|uniref:serine/threonine-protein kinase n=1 Tax=Streptomyces yunnanensis TaxID=156453 RepID=UPI003B8310B3
MFALAAGLAEALVSIHGAQLVHRDLKPSNVLLATDGPRVIDFGIARVAEGSSLTVTGIALGSPGFMSPEQVNGEEIGPASDVFSLGTVLAFAATGGNPFGNGHLASLLYRVVHDAPDLAAVTDPALRALITDCLAKDPAQRPTPRSILTRWGTNPPRPPPRPPVRSRSGSGDWTSARARRRRTRSAPMTTPRPMSAGVWATAAPRSSTASAARSPCAARRSTPARDTALRPGPVRGAGRGAGARGRAVNRCDRRRGALRSRLGSGSA